MPRWRKSRAAARSCGCQAKIGQSLRKSTAETNFMGDGLTDHAAAGSCSLALSAPQHDWSVFPVRTAPPQTHPLMCRLWMGASCCRVATLKEVLALVNAAEKMGTTIGVAIHTLVRAPGCSSPAKNRSLSPAS